MRRMGNMIKRSSVDLGYDMNASMAHGEVDCCFRLGCEDERHVVLVRLAKAVLT